MKIIKCIVCLMIIVSLFCLCGCFDRRELDTIGIVMGVAIDKAKDQDGFTVTLQLANPSESGSKSEDKEENNSGGSSAEFINIGDTGKFVNIGLREMQNKMSRMLYVAHSQCIVISEELAKEGVRDCLDFFSRAPEARASQFLFMAEGKAADIFNVQPEFESMPTTMLIKMLKDQTLTSQAPVATLFDFLGDMIRKTNAPVMPIVRIIEDEGERLKVDGCAVFKSDRMVGKLDEAQTRGMLFIDNKVKEGVIPLEIEDAGITAEILKAKSSVKTVLYEDGSFEYNVEVKVTLGLGDQTGTFNVTAPENTPRFLAEAEEAIKNEIQSAVDQSIKLNADIFGFGKYLNRKYPKQWENMRDSWDDLYPSIAVNINVKANADGVGRIMMPLTPDAV